MTTQGQVRKASLLRLVVVIATYACVLGLLWQFAIILFAVPSYLVPEPLAVFKSAVQNVDLLGRQTGLTVGSAALGLLLSTLVAFALAAGYLLNPRLEQATMPIVVGLRSAPIAAVAPIIMLMLGRGVSTSVVVVMIVTFFPLLVNLARGLRATNRNAAEMLHVYNASHWQELTLVRLPYALPYLFTGLRIAGANAVLGAMLSEWITGSRGIGTLILESGQLREIELLWAAVLISVAIALITFALTSAGERRVVNWRT